MICYGVVLRFNLFFGKQWYTNIFTNSYIQVSHSFTIIGLIAECTLGLFDTVNTLACIYFRICSNWIKLHSGLLFLKQIFLKMATLKTLKINVSKDLWITLETT